MKIYLYANIKNPEQLLQHQETMQVLKNLGVFVESNIRKSSIDNMDTDLIGQLDALIIDGSSAEGQAGYLLAVGLSHKKPVLYLIPKGIELDPSIRALSRNKEVKKCLHVEFYSKDNVIKKIKNYLSRLDDNIGKEAYSIKFTLRLSPRLDRYLAWLSTKKKTKKADFIRDTLKKMIDEDEEYRNRLK